MAHDAGISARIQHRIDDMFMPASIKRTLAEIKELQRSGRLEFGDKLSLKNLTTSGKKGGADDKKDDKPGDVVTTPDGETFTPAQDATIVRMKIEGRFWADIGAEIGKHKDVVSSRFREIKPADFDAKEAEWKKNNGGGDGGKGKGNQNNQNNQNHQNNQSQQQGGKGNNNSNQNNQQHEGKKNKNNQHNRNHNMKQEQTQADAGADNDTVSDAGTWAVADENFTEKEVTVLGKIVEIELRNAFVRIAKSFAAHKDGKRVHPDSIAQKVLGEGLDLSSLGGS